MFAAALRVGVPRYQRHCAAGDVVKGMTSSMFTAPTQRPLDSPEAIA
jgi:hypothetical protein